MKLTLKNIGKIGTASVEINGITVIAGENNTGKSTVGKALYCLFTAFHNINDKIVEERSLSIYRAISAPFRKRRANILMAPNGLRRIAEEICKNRTRYIDSTDELRKILEGIYKNNKVYDIGTENGVEDGIDAIFSKVFSYLKLEDNTIKANVLKNILQSEFNMQISHVNAQDLLSSMVLEFHGEKCINVEVVNNEAINIKSVEMSRNVQSGNTQNLKSTVIQRSFPKWSVAERRKTAAASDQAAVCACAHSRYFTGGSPSGLRV